MFLNLLLLYKQITISFPISHCYSECCSNAQNREVAKKSFIRAQDFSDRCLWCVRGKRKISYVYALKSITIAKQNNEEEHSCSDFIVVSGSDVIVVSDFIVLSCSDCIVVISR